MAITVLKHNVPWGPFSRDQVREALSRGDFTLHYLAHAPGLKEWLPLGEVLDYVERGVIPPPVPATQNLPAVPALPGVTPLSLPAHPPSLPQKIVRPPALPDRADAEIPEEVELLTAPFFPRAIAFAIDCSVLFMPILLVYVVGVVLIEAQALFEHTDKETMRQSWILLDRSFKGLFLWVALGLAWLYAAGLESSRWQATVGKQCVGLRVTDGRGERLSFFRATGRHLAKYLSALPCFLGFIMALFSSRGRTFHDWVAGTRVIRN